MLLYCWRKKDCERVFAAEKLTKPLTEDSVLLQQCILSGKAVVVHYFLQFMQHFTLQSQLQWLPHRETYFFYMFVQFLQLSLILFFQRKKKEKKTITWKQSSQQACRILPLNSQRFFKMRVGRRVKEGSSPRQPSSLSGQNWSGAS